MSREEENEERIRMRERENIIQLRVSETGLPAIPVKLGLEDSDKEILEGILAELQKVNNSLEQILNLLHKK